MSNVDKTAPERCDLLIRNAYVITMDADNSKHPNGAIAVRGRNIVAVGPDSELTSRFKPLRTLDARGGAVHPGYIDLHYHVSGHLPSKLLEDGVASSAGAGKWIASRYERFFNALGDEEEHASAMLASLDMLRNGFTSFTEPGTVHSTDAVADACNALGIRAWVGDPWLMDVGGEGHLNINRAPFDTKRSLSLLGGELKRNVDPDTLVRGHVAIYGSGTQTDRVDGSRQGLRRRERRDLQFSPVYVRWRLPAGRSARLSSLGRKGGPGLQVPLYPQQRYQGTRNAARAGLGLDHRLGPGQFLLLRTAPQLPQPHP